MSMMPAAEFGDAAPHSAGMPAKSVQFFVQMVILGTFLLGVRIWQPFSRHEPGAKQSHKLQPLVASERVFSLVKCMFGKDQLSSLGDQLQGSVMLRYNRRNVG